VGNFDLRLTIHRFNSFFKKSSLWRKVGKSGR